MAKKKQTLKAYLSTTGSRVCTSNWNHDDPTGLVQKLEDAIYSAADETIQLGLEAMVDQDDFWCMLMTDDSKEFPDASFDPERPLRCGLSLPFGDPDLGDPVVGFDISVVVRLWIEAHAGYKSEARNFPKSEIPYAVAIATELATLFREVCDRLDPKEVAKLADTKGGI